MGMFVSIGDEIDDIFSLIDSAATSDLMTELSILFSISITIMITIKGYAILAGKTQDPIREILWDLVLKAVIITFALNIGGWLTMVIDAMNGIHQWAGGRVSLYAEMDQLFAKAKEVANMAYEKGNMFSGTIALLLVYLGFFIGAIPALIITIVTSFTLKILVMIAPFMFFALFYGWLKNMFTQWLSLFFANTLAVLSVTLIFSAVVNKFENFISHSGNSINNGLDPFYVGVQVIIVGVLLVVLVYVAYHIAEKVATVSMESVMKSSFGRTLQDGKNIGGASGSAAGRSYTVVRTQVDKYRGKKG
ncbi:conjugal transfer protein TrbL [Halarcobacter mediterraneus]|uniref:Conjugal transfer protein TrbL n=1 Tax=Halarcobacter mediterraneus TaxID=2023153 RepID=A0A4Q1ATY1_9BACT|nr:type IV secretion system protein [Halarcobacter mediterraneus]RXK13233.1 conjugal transfer protein TrbL [Halarcobacter mediterraneus]